LAIRNAYSKRPSPAMKPAQRVTARRTFCRICEAACALRAECDAGGRLLRLYPDREDPVSRGFACAKGTRFVDVAHHPDRLLSPLQRQADGRYQAVAWEVAMAQCEARLRPIVERHGPHAIALYVGNPLAFNVMGAVSALALMRALGSRNVFTAGSQDCNNKFRGAQIVHGSPLIHPLPDFEHADFALMLGTNPAVSQSSFIHLAGGSTVFDRLARRGGRVLWVDPRRTESAQRWGEHVAIRPGTDIFLLLALLHALRHRYRPHPHVEGLETLLELASGYPAARAARLTGLAAERIEAIAEALQQARRAVVHMSVGVNQGPFGTLCYVALQALAYLCGQFDQRGGLLFHPVAVGLGEIGRRFGLGDSEPRSRIDAFPSLMKSLPAGILADEILTPGAEQVRALIVLSGNPLTSIPGESRLREAFERLEFTVCVDLFQNATGALADLILPTPCWLERWDVAAAAMMFQHASRLPYAGAVQAPPGEVRSEARILADISLALGRPLWGLRAAARLWGRLPWDVVMQMACNAASFPLRLWRRGATGLPSLKPKPGAYLGRGPRTLGRRVRFWHDDLQGEIARLSSYAASVEDDGKLHPAGSLTLICRRRRLGQNSWLHGAAKDGKAEDAVWLAPDDLQALDLPQGGLVRLQTAGGALTMMATPVDSVEPGLVVAPHGLPGANVNQLIPSSLERIEPLSGQHWMTGIPVRVTPVAARESLFPETRLHG
jgi:anaerobic selenocysteine-containing dehydrogenase